MCTLSSCPEGEYLNLNNCEFIFVHMYFLGKFSRDLLLYYVYAMQSMYLCIKYIKEEGTLKGNFTEGDTKDSRNSDYRLER